MVYEKERVSQILSEMKKEEEFILQEKLQLEEEKKQFKQQRQKYLLIKQKWKIQLEDFKLEKVIKRKEH